MSAALALAFFDLDRQLYGTARSGATVLFDGRKPTHLEGPEIEPAGDAWRVSLAGRLELELNPVGSEMQLGMVSARLCRVSGEVGGRSIECLGTLAETREPPRWEELDAVRSLSALIDEQNALVALARRPRNSAGHGDELVRAVLVRDGKPMEVEEARISTVYDGEGRQRSAGLELWMPGEEFSLRGSGQVIAGSSLDLDAVQVHEAIFRWRLDGREGIGAYELMLRREPPAAA